MNRILKTHIERFTALYELSSKDLGSQFEYFVNYLVVSRHYPMPFELEDISTGGGNDLGIDGIAILVDNQLVTSIEELNDIASSSRWLPIHFVFIQSKTTASFDAAEIGNFGEGVKDFMNDILDGIPANDAIKSFHEIKNLVYDLADKFDGNPKCSLYYVTPGIWTDDPVLSRRLASVQKLITDLGLFSEVVASCVDSNRIQRWHSELQNRVERKFEFKSYCDIPPISGVRESYLVVAEADEYLRVITDDEGLLMRSAFYENVRDFQGMNSVNQEIMDTIEDPVAADRFPVLNNGITIVSRAGQKTGNQFVLRDFQVVNGCQTSNILYRSSGSRAHMVNVPIKIVYTDSPDVIANIVLAANRQTEVRPEAFESIQPFHKKLEEHYSTYTDSNGKQILYYERRSRQYSELGIPQSRIVNIPQQIRSHVSVMLEMPHQTYRYYSKLLSVHRKSLFQTDHCFTSYFASALTVNRVQAEFLSKRLSLHPRWKYHLALLVRRMTCNGSIPPANSERKTEAYVEPLIKAMLDEEASRRIIGSAAERLVAIFQSLGAREPNPRDPRICDSLNAVSSQRSAASTRQRLRGRISRIVQNRGYGFIEKGADSWFFHKSDLRPELEWEAITENLEVNFDPSSGPKGPAAKDIGA